MCFCKTYRADDSYFSFASAFLNNTISISQLEKAMVLGKLGEQIVSMSEKAFSALKFKEATPAQKEIYYPKKLARDTAARNEFRKEKKKGNAITEKYILDIMREGWVNNDGKFVETANEMIARSKRNSKSKLSQIRKARGFTQAEIANASGIILRMVQLYERYIGA